MKTFWKWVGCSGGAIIGIFLVLLDLVWTGNIPGLAAWIFAGVAFVVWAVFAWVWSVNLPPRCRKCGVIYKPEDHFKKDPDLTMRGIEVNSTLDLTVCTQCADVPKPVGVNK